MENHRQALGSGSVVVWRGVTFRRQRDAGHLVVLWKGLRAEKGRAAWPCPGPPRTKLAEPGGLLCRGGQPTGRLWPNTQHLMTCIVCSCLRAAVVELNLEAES